MAVPYGFTDLAFRPTQAIMEGLNASVQPAALELTDRDIDAIARVVQSEVGHFYGRGYGDADKAVAAVVDTILNRADSGQFPRSIEGVVNQPLQFSAINDKGTWERLPQASASVRDAVRGHLEARASGAPSSIGGALNFLNPFASGDRALREWGNAVKENPVGVFGRGRDIHYHGTAPGMRPHEATQISIAGFTPQGRSPLAPDYGAGRMQAPARDMTYTPPAFNAALSYAPTLPMAPAAQAATAMATSLPSKGPDMARSSARDYGFTQAMTPVPRSVQSSDVSRRDMGWMNPIPGAAPMPADRFMSQRDWLSAMPPGSGRSDVARSLVTLPQSSVPPLQFAPARAAPSGVMTPANLAAMAALYGQSPKQLGAPILDSRAFRPTPMSAPVKDVRPVYNPPRPAQAPQRAPAAPARTGGNALTRGLQAVTQAARSLTSGDAAQAAVGLLSGYGGGSVPAGGNPSMFAGTGYSWSNPGAYAGGNPYEYAFAATPFR